MSMTCWRRLTTIAAGPILAATLFAASPAFAAFEDGVKAYLAKDYRTALSQWRPLAEKGHAGAQFGLGLSYENGRGVERDLTEAAIWYRRSAEQGLADAQFNLGNLYLHGQGVKKDAQEAVRWYRMAGDQGMPHAQVNLGYSYEVGSGVPADAGQAVKWYRRAAQQDFAQAHFYMGAAYERGSGVDRSPEIAAAWYQRAADKGIKQARERLEGLLAQGVKPVRQSALSTGVSTAEPKPAVMAAKEAEKPEVKADPAPKPAAQTAAQTAAKSAADKEPEKPKVEASKPEPAKKEKKQTAASAPPAATPAASKTEPGERVASLADTFRVRLASYREAKNADKGWALLAKKHKDILGSLSYSIVRTDLGAKGVFHRLEAGPLASSQVANEVCAEIKRRGDHCIIVKPGSGNG